MRHNARLQDHAIACCLRTLHTLFYHTIHVTSSCIYLQGLPFHSPDYNTSIACMQVVKVMRWPNWMQQRASEVSLPACNTYKSTMTWLLPLLTQNLIHSVNQNTHQMLRVLHCKCLISTGLTNNCMPSKQKCPKLW